jgi:hypothetical protein
MVHRPAAMRGTKLLGTGTGHLGPRAGEIHGAATDHWVRQARLKIDFTRAPVEAAIRARLSARVREGRWAAWRYRGGGPIRVELAQVLV